MDKALRSTTYLLLAMLFMAACSKSSDPSVLPPDNIADEYVVDMWEQLGTPGRSFSLNVSTIGIQPDCINHSIDFNFEAQSEIFKLSLNGIQDAADCEPGQAPARSEIKVGQLDVGFYDLEINLDNLVINKGTIAVSFDKYEIEINSSNGFKLKRSALYKVPENSIWGYIAYNDIDYADEADDFISFFNDFDSAPQQEGYYGYYRIDNQGKIVIDNQTNMQYFRAFTFSNVNEFDNVKDIVDQYRALHGSAFEISIMLSNGAAL